MPPPYVRTIRDELLYEYAKLISRSALGKISYPFVSDRFKALRDGTITMSGTIREWALETSGARACAFCEAAGDLQRDHLVPASRGGPDSADNLVWTCGACNQSRGSRGIFEWLGLEKKDDLPRLVAGKYLKILYEMHERAGVLPVDRKRLPDLCARCRLPEVCEKWDTVQKISCLCLESIF